MGLDINTPKGKETLEQEKRASQILMEAWSGVEYVHTPKGTTAVIDGMLVKDGILRGVVETKCRPSMNLIQLRGPFNNEWLISYHKLTGGSEVAIKLCVGLWGCLYLVPDDTVLMVHLFDPKTGWKTPFRVERTETQKTVNGGRMIRDNAYVRMDGAKLFRGRT